MDAVRPEIESAPLQPETSEELTSDTVLVVLRPGMESLCYLVESGKSAHQKITRPILSGDDGRPEGSYEIDAFHDD